MTLNATPVFTEAATNLPKGSYVVPFWVCYGFWGKGLYYNVLPKKEQHRRVWVNPIHLNRHLKPKTRQFDQEVLRFLVEARASVHKARGRKGLEFLGFRALDGLGFRV